MKHFRNVVLWSRVQRIYEVIWGSIYGFVCKSPTSCVIKTIYLLIYTLHAKNNNLKIDIFLFLFASPKCYIIHWNLLNFCLYLSLWTSANVCRNEIKSSNTGTSWVTKNCMDAIYQESKSSKHVCNNIYLVFLWITFLKISKNIALQPKKTQKINNFIK